MKKFHLFSLAALLLLFTVSCSKEPKSPKVVAPTIQEVTGIQTTYELGLHEFLEINPDVVIDNDNVDGLSYEWIINYKVVSNEKNLKFKCAELGDFTGNFKVVSEKGALITDFKFSVTSPYDTGLLLLSETQEGAMLTFKRLDIMDTPASPYAFKDNNPGMGLGKKALCITWMGSYLTNLGKATSESDLEVLISTDDPKKVYTVDPKTLKVKNEVVGDFTANNILIGYGFQNGMCQKAYFVGNGREKALSANNEIIESDVTAEYPIADLTCSVITDNTDMQRIYYNTGTKTLLYNGLTGVEMGAGKTQLEAPKFMHEFAGIYREPSASNRYEPGKVLYVDKNCKVYLLTPCDFVQDEMVEAEIDGAGKILPESAIGANPVKPILYYSNGSGIYRLNVDGKQFDSTPYIQLDGNFAVKQIIFNNYDPNTVYIAAENLDEKSQMKASLFIYDIKDNSKAVKLFEDHQVGGAVKQLIFKGNGREFEHAPQEAKPTFTKLFR